MNIVHVVRDLDIASGGPSRSVPALALSQSEHNEGNRTWIVFQDRGVPVVNFEGGNERHSRLRVGPFSIVSELRRIQEGVGIDLIHLHGLWSPVIYQAAKFARQANIPYVVSPRGMLSQWCLENKAFKKRVAWMVYQKRNLRAAACIHATSDAEREDILRLGCDGPIAVIPNGCVINSAGDSSKVASEPELKLGPRWAFSMGRLHSVKGFDNLLLSWADLAPANWKLAIAGPDEAGYLENLQQIVSDKGLQDDVRFLGPVGSETKQRLFQQAELFVLASHSENFGLAIAEALSAGVPVVTTTGTPWREIQDRQCGWWVSPDRRSITVALGDATSRTAAQLSDMGLRGAELIESSYRWSTVARRLLQVYQWAIDSDSCVVSNDLHC